MADAKISALTNLTAADPTNDMIPIVDVSETPPASGNTKRISINNILSSSPTASGALTVTGLVTAGSATITGDLTVRTTGLTVNSSGVGVGVTAALGAGNIQIGAGKYLGYSATAYMTPEDNVQGARIKANNILVDATSESKFNIGGTLAMTLNATGLGVGGVPSGVNRFLIFNGATQALTLDTSGNLLVGKTANYGAGEINTLQLKSSVFFASDNTGSASNRNWSIGTNVSGAGNMEWTISSTNTGIPNLAYRMQITSAGNVNNTTGTYGTISDLRLKENVSDARNYLADLLKLRVVKYSLKEEASAVATKLGFIAQEVEQVFPNLVDQSDKEYEGAEGIRSVKTSILIPMLLKAIQELTARVQTLEAR